MTLDRFYEWLYIEFGVVLSLLIPWAIGILRIAGGRGQSNTRAVAPQPPWYVIWISEQLAKFWFISKSYVLYLIASMVVSAGVLLAALGLELKIDQPWKWIALGFAWDTIIAKFIREAPLGFRNVPNEK